MGRGKDEFVLAYHSRFQRNGSERVETGLFFSLPPHTGGALHTRTHTPPVHTTLGGMGLFGLFGGGGKKAGSADDDDYDNRLPPLEPLVPRPPRPTSRPKLTDDDRDVFAYARDMTAGNVW